MKQIEINVKTGATSYDQLFPETEAKNVAFDKEESKLKVADVQEAIDTVYSQIDGAAATVGEVLVLENGLVIIGKDITLTTSAWVSDSTYSNYPYRADIPLNGVHADYVPDVYFNMADAVSGNFAPVSLSGANKVSIYAATKPTSTMTIPSVECVTDKDHIAHVTQLLKIEVAHLPNKTTYTEGDTLDLTGLQIRAVYDDDTSQIVTGWTANPAHGTVLSTSNTSVIITYTDNGGGE